MKQMGGAGDWDIFIWANSFLKFLIQNKINLLLTFVCTIWTYIKLKNCDFYVLIYLGQQLTEQWIFKKISKFSIFWFQIRLSPEM